MLFKPNTAFICGGKLANTWFIRAASSMKTGENE